MTLSTNFFRKIFNSVSPHASVTRRLLLRRPVPRRSLHARVGPIAAIAGGAAGVTGLAAYLSKTPSSAASGNDDASILVPQIRPLKKDDETGKARVDSPVKVLDVAAATELLRQGQKSKLFELGNGQRGRCDVVRFASNHPVEDEYSIGTGAGTGGSPWTFWGVYDGHAGWATSSVLRDTLIPFVSDALSQLPASASSSQISQTITRAFLDLDNRINDIALSTMNDPSASPGSATVLSAIAPALSGSCALLAAYDPSQSTLRVACVGDSRAVLGRRRRDGIANEYATIPLSADQTGKNPAEHARLTALHPDEPKMLDRDSGRLLGLAVTRAFGDHRWKWAHDAIAEAQQKHWGTAPRPESRTPPYLTAAPAIEETRVGPGDFLIMASDGFWDHVGSEDAVACVARWVQAQRAGVLTGVPTDALRYRPREGGVKQGGEGWWLEEDKYATWQATPEFFVAEDENAATHLVRNAFGGSRRGLFCGVMSTYPPMSRNVRDDITVQVIFFGDV